MSAPEPGRESFFAWADRVTDAEEAERGAAPEPGRAAAPTPGQAAYEAFLPNGPIDWEYADSDVHAMWEAAAQAAIAAAPHARIAGLEAQLAELTDMLGVAVQALNEIAEDDTGDVESIAGSALGIIANKLPGDARWTLASEHDDLADQLAGLRDRIDSMARGLDMSARTTAPSKKSEIESSVADALFGLLRIDGESIADTRRRLGVPQ